MASSGEVIFGGEGADVILAGKEGGARIFDGDAMVGDLYGSYASDGDVDRISVRNGVQDHVFCGTEDFLELDADPFDLVSIFDPQGRSNGNEGGNDFIARLRYAAGGGNWDVIRTIYESGFLVLAPGPGVSQGR